MVEHKILDDEEIESSTNRWRVAGLVLMALFVLAFPVYRLYEPAQRAEARTAQLQFLADQGAGLFENNCSSCHGLAGAGGIAPALGSRDFLQSVNDQQIRELVSLGIPGTEMVSYSNDFGGPMTATQINAITTYLRSLEEEAVANPNWRTPLADEDLTGQDIFVLACSRCHGIDLGGKKDDAPAIGPGSEVVEDSDARIAKRIREGKDAMPRFGRILTDEQIDMVIAYIREVQQGG